MRARGTLAFAAAVAAAVAVAGMASLSGCNSSHADSAAALRSSANSICTKANRQAAAIAKPNASDLKASAAYLDKLLPIEQQMVGSLRALHVPAANADAFNKGLASFQQLLDAEAKEAAAMSSNDASTITSVAKQMESIGNDLDQQFGPLGLTSCSSGSSSSTTTTTG